jgi:Lrp/AsnC family leucine-responsive transcriptional regulator
MQIDRFDRQILQVLQQEGRISNQELADRIGLSPSPCLRRVRALEEAGLITGYRALLDPKALGLSLMALIHISMDQHTPERFSHLEAAISEIPEVMECLLITGQSADYQLKVVVKDMDAYQELLPQSDHRYQGGDRCPFELCSAPGGEQDGAADRRDLVAVTSWSSVAPAQQEAARIDGAGQIFGDG